MIEYLNYYFNALYTWWYRLQCKHPKGFSELHNGKLRCPSCGEEAEEHHL